MKKRIIFLSAFLLPSIACPMDRASTPAEILQAIRNNIERTISPGPQREELLFKINTAILLAPNPRLADDVSRLTNEVLQGLGDPQAAVSEPAKSTVTRAKAVSTRALPAGTTFVETEHGQFDQKFGHACTVIAHGVAQRLLSKQVKLESITEDELARLVKDGGTMHKRLKAQTAQELVDNGIVSSQAEAMELVGSENEAMDINAFLKAFPKIKKTMEDMRLYSRQALIDSLASLTDLAEKKHERVCAVYTALGRNESQTICYDEQTSQWALFDSHRKASSRDAGASMIVFPDGARLAEFVARDAVFDIDSKADNRDFEPGALIQVYSASSPAAPASPAPATPIPVSPTPTTPAAARPSTPAPQVDLMTARTELRALQTNNPVPVLNDEITSLFNLVNCLWNQPSTIATQREKSEKEAIDRFIELKELLNAMEKSKQA